MERSRSERGVRERGERDSAVGGGGRAGARRLGLVAGALVVAGLALPAAADLIVTYELEGAFVVISPLGDEAAPLSDTGEVPFWSTGLWEDYFGNVNKTVRFNNEAVPCDPVGGACPREGLVSFGTDPAETTNSITIRFENATEEGGLESIGPGPIEVLSLDYFTLGLTDVGGIINMKITTETDTDVAGAIGNLNAEGVVDAWSQDSAGINHAQIMCVSPSFCSAATFISEELNLVHETYSAEGQNLFQIAVTGDREATDNVPESVGMTFTNGFKDISFESTGPKVLDESSRTFFKTVPEPEGALMAGAALLTLAGLRGRRPRGAIVESPSAPC